MGILTGSIFGGLLIAVCEWWRRLTHRATFEELVPPWAEDMPGSALYR